MSYKILSGAVVGLDSKIIEVEIDVSPGVRSFNIVGLGDKAVEESKERVNSALKSIGFSPPYAQRKRILVNLAPADLRKEGSLYDLPIALGYLLASKQVKFYSEDKIFAGELSLDGKLKPIKGALSLALLAQEKKLKEIIIPKENEKEASLVLLSKNNYKIKIVGLEKLGDVLDYLNNKIDIKPLFLNLKDFSSAPGYYFDFSWIKGQESAKRALEIAAAGGHNIFMQGPPGTGKSLMARCLPSILPSLSFEEALEVTKIYSVGGFLSPDMPLIKHRPFRAPHHTASESALIGGGNPIRPGEITLAHRGILFLDEFPEFHRDVLESLRQSLEEGKISILRARERLIFPAKFTLVAASNPCPCGYYGSSIKECRCSPGQIQKYKRKLSGPLMDRIDIFIDVPALDFEKIADFSLNETSKEIKKRIEKARIIQKERFLKENKKILVNSEMEIPLIEKYCQIDFKSQSILKKAVDSGNLSTRGYHRVLKTARTIADLEESEKIKYEHLAEALMYRLRED